MKYGFYFLLALTLIFTAYNAAQNKIQRPLHLEAIKIGMTTSDIESHFGSPSARTRNQTTYILEDGSELTLTFREKLLSSAKVKFHRVIKIEDPQMRKLTLVQMDADQYESANPSWFFAGKPEEGLIYKISSQGTIESLTWVPPFSVSQNQPKQLQALLRDFNTQRSL